MTTGQRWLVFNTVGVLGFGLQMLLLWALVEGGGLPAAGAAALAIEVTILHNFAWHVRWTWKDRPCTFREGLRRLVRFHAANGLISLAVGTAIVWAGTSLLGWHVLAANAVGVGVCAVLNFVAGDRWAFRRAAATAWRHESVRPTVAVLVAIGGLTAVTSAAELRPETLRAFDAYVQRVETATAAWERAGAPFLWLDASPARAARGRRGEVVVESLTPDGPLEIEGGLVHDWMASVWIAGGTLDEVLALIADVDRHATVYAPEVVRARILQRDGDTLRTSLRLLKHKVITVVLDTEHVSRIERLSAKRARNWSRSVRISEVRDAGRPDERVLPPGEGHGFLWALNSYWRVEEAGGGVFVECRAVSLTRRIPTGLGWLIGPIVSDLPRESLARTLAATRTGVAAPGR